MDPRFGSRRVLLCGGAGARKKDLLIAWAKQLGVAPPAIIETTSGMPQELFCEAQLPLSGAVRFAGFHGPVFFFERAIHDLFSRPASLVVYFLRATTDEYLQTRTEVEHEVFDNTLAAAKRFGRSYRHVPWLFVKSHSWYPDPLWITEAIPEEFRDTMLTVNVGKGLGTAELLAAVDARLASLGTAS